MENEEYIEPTTEVRQKVHYSSGLIHQRAERFKALACMKINELEAIYHLVESHAPGLRMKTVLRFEKILTSAADNAQLSLPKSDVALNCVNTKIHDNVNIMLEKIKKMPSEWTIVQLTPRLNPYETAESDPDKHYTNPLYISVFNCGANEPRPFCVGIQAPKDRVNGAQIELVSEMHSIVFDNRNTLMSSKDYFKNVPEKQNYFMKRQAIDNRLKILVKDLQDLYLKEWRCLMIGKYINDELEIKIRNRVGLYFKNELPSFKLDDKNKDLLQYLVKGASYLKLTEMKAAVKSIIPEVDKNLQKNVAIFIRNLSQELSLAEEKRHPLILIIDDSLDCFPWEMIDVLVDIPVSRLPSLHLAYALFNEHKSTIKNGFKIVNNPENGTFVVNPDSDLRNMQNRISSFFEYWVPSWNGLVGLKPTEEKFQELLVSADIFSYNGHGSGSHFFPMQHIERMHVSAVVLLFGCGSTKLVKVGPQSEMFGTYQMYLIACSPCIVGMLWEVTDLDTDMLTTELLSQWIPSFKTHWKFLDKAQWKKGEKVDFSKDETKIKSENQPHEPELLKALSLAKKSNLSFYVTKAACVARGIPVKII